VLPADARNTQKERTTFFNFLDILNIGDKPLNTNTIAFTAFIFCCIGFFI
jgi:hypothetical protein